MSQSIKLMTALGLAAAFVLSANMPSFARSRHVAAVHKVRMPSPHKVRADANGHFFFPANYFDDSYVYDPPATRRHAKARTTSSRHRPHGS